MRITNMLHFTENHRFYVYREFTLSSLDLKMLSGIYQPMVGGFAVSLFHTLYQQVDADRIGYSGLEQQRKLFLALDVEPGEQGRRFFVEQASKLEAVGLMQTNRKYVPSKDEYIFEYVLFAPLAPHEFFKNHHLVMLLRDKVGKYAVIALKESFYAPEPDELKEHDIQSEELSVPFYDLFRLNTQVIDYELEQALYETAPAREPESRPDVATKAFQYSDIITRFPKETSRNRPFVERLRFRPDQLAAINMVAHKYNLTLRETCRLLDEDGMFSEDGELQIDLLRYKANLLYRQDNEREEERERLLHKIAQLTREAPSEQPAEKPVEMEYYLDVPAMFVGQCNIHQYNMLLRNEPYTKVLSRFFPKGTVPKPVLDIFEKIDLNYRLPDEVINVLIHHLHTYKESSWTKNYIDTIASDMLAKQIDSYEKAVEYIRDQTRKRAERAASAKDRGRRGSRKKPEISIISDVPAPTPLSDEQLEEIRKKALKRDGKLK